MSVDKLLAALDPGGRDFERLCKWILKNVPEYRSQIQQVWLWDEWPGRRGRDIGIDLVAEDRESGLWAIQAKHYDPAYAIKKADLDSFLSASSRADFTYRLLIATTDHLGSNARSALAIQEKPVGTLLRSQLDLLDVAWPSSINRLRPAKPKRKRPRPHQRRAIQDCVTGLASADRGQLVMACGTGKTLVGSFLAERLAARRVLVLVPSLSLLGQTLREWATAVEFDYLAVCSDDTVTKDEQDAVVASTSELGIPVTTDPERIARFLRRRGAETKVVFSTYQSSPQIAAAQASRAPAFDLVIADEAHRCAGPQAGVFATVLDTTKIKARRRLFMTATPRYFTGRVKKEAQEADWEVASMDEEAKFGGVLHRLTFAQAIDQDLLSDYQVVVVGVSDREARDLAERGAFVSPDGESVTDARTLAREIGLLRSMAKYNLRRVVTFHSRIHLASRFASSLPETKAWLPSRRRPTGVLWTDHVSGKMTAGERDARLRRLERLNGNERGVLTNARCLNEGVDVPTLDGVAFIDPRRSQVDVVQAVGRAIRKAEDKTVGTIVIPVLVGGDTKPEAALDTSEFNRVWQIVRALRNHDENLAQEIDELRRESGRRGTTGQRPRKIRLDLPVRIGSAFARAFDTRLVETSSSGWEFWFGLLQSFIEREGHARVPQPHRESGHRLGHWVGNQRIARSSLSAERQKRLESLPGWTWHARSLRWDQAFGLLKQFIAREGHALVPAQHIEDGFYLGAWVRAQRGDAADGSLDASRRARLESVSGWIWDASASADWERGFSYLRRYVERYGTSRVAANHVEADGYHLGRWCSKQRAKYSRRELDANQAERLNALPGWWWSSTHRAQWDEWFALLAKFAGREGHTVVPLRHAEDGRALGKWVSHQRNRYAYAALSPEQIVKLEGLSGWTWDVLEARWDQRFALLARFAGRVGDANVPARYVESGVALGKWASHQKANYAKKELSADRVARLEALPHWTWDANEARWEEGLTSLKRFVEREGHARVPNRHQEDGFKLGQWVQNKRWGHRRGELPAERAALLEALPGWTWDTRTRPEVNNASGLQLALLDQ